MIEAVLGIDPGSVTGWALAAVGDRRLLAGGSVKLEKLGPVTQARAVASWGVEVRRGDWIIAGVTIEDVTEGATYNRELNALGDVESGHYRNPSSTAKLNRVFGMFVAAAVINWHVPVSAVPISKWYLRLGGKMAKKAEAIQYFRASAGAMRPVLKNEHISMAYGLARYGAQELSNSRRLVRPPR